MASTAARRRLSRTALGLVFLFGWACSSDSPSEPPLVVGLISGTWQVTVEVVAGTAAAPGTMEAMVATLIQDGTTFSGDFAFEDGDTSTISGRLAQRDFLFDGTQTTASCPGVFTGQGSLSETNSAMNGTYSAQACDGTVNARFFAFKQQ